MLAGFARTGLAGMCETPQAAIDPLVREMLNLSAFSWKKQSSTIREPFSFTSPGVDCWLIRRYRLFGEFRAYIKDPTFKHNDFWSRKSSTVISVIVLVS